ncbi:MAG TPA: IS1595 family transposase [Gemmatimonadales bacterium]|nr:IS1595 family transposase [Gemmatimonadales bacterium]
MVGKNKKPTRKKPWNVAGDKTATVAAIPFACSSELAAIEFMEKQRWGATPACPHCGALDVYMMRNSQGERAPRYLWRCKSCKRQYSVRIGTVLEDSRIPLRHWCYAFWAACASKKGVSALQIKRQTGLSYKSALFLMHRIRWAMSDHQPGPLTGTVEVDETYVGGKPRNQRTRQEMGRTKRTPVMALVERGGRVRAFPLDRVTPTTLKQHVRENVDLSARIMTDDALPYRGLAPEYRGGHFRVRHSIGEYARKPDITTNTVEGFFSLLKRGMYGTFHSVSKRHLHRYVDEFAFRYNTREMDDGERTIAAIRGADGKRLMYSTPTR